MIVDGICHIDTPIDLHTRDGPEKPPRDDHIVNTFGHLTIGAGPSLTRIPMGGGQEGGGEAEVKLKTQPMQMFTWDVLGIW